MITGAINRFRVFITEGYKELKPEKLLFSDINKEMIERFVEYLEKHSRGEGAHGYFQRFKKIMKYAIDNGMRSNDPTRGVKCSTVEGLRKDILSNGEIALLAQTPCKNIVLKEAFIFCCCTGLRFCDIKELRYSDIDFATNKLNINQQKTGKSVIIDLNKTAQKILASRPGEPHEFVFNLHSSEGCNKTIKAWVKRAGINKHITWHCARHSFAVNLLTSEQRPDIKTVSSTLGHTTLRHTEKYTRVIDELKKAAVEALPEYL
jgi:integrase